MERFGTDEPLMAMMWFLGWQSPNRVVVLDAFRGDSVIASNLDASGVEVLSRVDTQPDDDRGIDSVQLAYLLLPDMMVGEPGAADRGPWPGWLRLAVGGPLTLALVFAVRTLYRRLRYTRLVRYLPPSRSLVDVTSP